MKRSALIFGALWLIGCRGDADPAEETTGGESRGIEPWEDGGRCDVTAEGRFAAEYDTTGDGKPDVRKVFIGTGSGTELGSVLVCRESDLDGDGTKDVFRFYPDDGSPFREEADRDFDGDIDEISLFDRGRLIRRDVDTNDDGRFDMRTYFERDVPVRRERDTAGRSTDNAWRPDRWEYYANGRLIRMGEDLDGDGTADRWDRDPRYVAPDEGAAPSSITREGEGTAESPADSTGTPAAPAAPE
ncbi:MAG: hypothetical protein H5U40_01320 [Polyangiaceae bacterium]|nr:hypothetical protein [Polyangiaceae bacterium]